MMMRTSRTLHIDLETYSDVDISQNGVYKYVDSDAFEILLFGYAYDNEPAKVLDLASGENLPPLIKQDLLDPTVLKKAHNANFERTCLQKYIGEAMRPEEWQCSAVRAAQLGLPRSLEDVGNAIGLAEDQKKLKTGKALIQYFCKPCRPTKTNGGRTRNLPHHEPVKWSLFKDYCAQDVETERYIDEKLALYPAESEVEHAIWCLDQRINELGVKVDTRMVQNILAYNDQYTDRLLDRSKELTGLENPQSLQQLKGWLHDKGVEVTSLDKETLAQQIAILEDNPKSDPAVLEVLQIRRELGKTSVAKYEAMDRSMTEDGRVHGMLMFYGASRTGRWAGRIVQLQNLPQNHLEELEEARSLVVNNDFDLLECFYPKPMDILSQLIRTAFIAGEGKTYVVCDYSAIEARVLGWLAGEEWVMETFRTTGKIYEATASQMFHVPIEEVGHGSDLRKKGKVATLACGYQGGVGALTAMDSKGDIPEEEKQSIIDKWRAANPKIVEFWNAVEQACIKALERPGIAYKINRGIKVVKLGKILFIYLPNGRPIAYYDAKLEERIKYNKPRKCITYMGSDQQTGKWVRLESYGGKMVENITQATARDCLATAMLKLYKAGYTPVMHIHDEVVIEVPESNAAYDIEKIKDIMAIDEPWTKDLILKAEGYITPFYKKD